MDYLEFIARVTSHIPNKGQVMIRYHGLYSNAHSKADSALYPPPLPSMGPGRMKWLNLQELGSKTASIST